MRKKRGKRLTKIHASTFMFVTLGIIIINIALATTLTSLIMKDSPSKESYQKIFDFSPLFKKKLTPTGYAIDEFRNPIAIVTIKADEEVGKVNDYFYGTNTHGYYLGKGTKVDADEDGTPESPSDLEWHRQAFLDSGMNYIRWDASLQHYYFYNESTNNYYFKGDLNPKIEQLRWANENGIKVLLIVDYMPSWLANISIEGCNLSRLINCPPYDYNIWKEIVVDYLDRLTENGKYAEVVDVEVWNEPYSNFWLNDLPYDDIKKAEEYVKLYNSTYNAIKYKYPSINVGGPSGTWQCSSPNLWSVFLSEIGNNADFISKHIYHEPRNSSGYYSTERIRVEIDRLMQNCSFYNLNCSRIIISEWNLDSDYLKNSSNINSFTSHLSQSYTRILNKYPQETSSVIYQWSERYKYSDKENYPEYPQRWSMVSEPKLDNDYYPSYNVTKDFAHYHAGGNMIVNSSSNNESIISVTSLNPDNIWHVTIINIGTSNISVSVDVSSTNIEALKDLDTGEIYTAKNGAVNVGILTEYDVKHYEGIANYEPSEKEKTATSASSSSSSGKSKIVSVDYLNILYDESITIETNQNKVIPTKEIFTEQSPSKTNNRNSNKKKENVYGPSQYQEDINELDYKTRTGTLSLALSKNNYLIIIIMLLGSIICISLIISITCKKKKHEAYKVRILTDWVNKARYLGYSNERMKEMLLEYKWDKKLVKNVVKG